MMFGPLVAMYLDRELPFQQSAPGGFLGRIKSAWNSWTLVDTRNYVIVSSMAFTEITMSTDV